MAETVLPSLHKALVQRLETSVVLKGDKVYNEGEVPRGSPIPYAVIATYNSSRTGANRIKMPGHGSGVQIRWWHQDKFSALEAFKEGCDLLDGYRLTLAGHTWEKGRLDYLLDYPEPDPEIGGHVVVSMYRLRSHVALA